MQKELGFGEAFIDQLPLVSFRAYYATARQLRDEHMANMAYAFRVAQADQNDFVAAMRDLRGERGV